MLDYWKLWITDSILIERVLNNPHINKQFTINQDGALIGINGKFNQWEIKTFAPELLQITGSIHKYWNKGTNENDFTFSNVAKAIENFIIDLEINPSKVFVKNLEFGVNLQLQVNATEIIEQIICFNGLQPLRPYEITPDFHFIEFKQWDYYLKIYDKGKQFRKRLPNTPNTLRIEIKAMNSRFLHSANITTLLDLLQLNNLQVLGLKLAKLLKGLIFEDDTIQIKELNKKEKILYRDLSNPRKWKHFKGNKTSSIKNKINKFKNLIESKGKRKIYSLITGAINDKIIQLSNNKEMSVFLPNTYTWKIDKKLFCLSCKKDITNQHKNSKFCSSKYVGESEAKKCRNNNSNPRNNRIRKIKNINSKGVLFDIMPFVIERVKRKTITA
jgi:hypothetical protein